MEDLWSPRRGGKATWARQLFCLAALCLGCLATGLGSVQHSQLRPQLLRTCSTRGLRDVVKPPKPKQQPPNRPKSWGSDGHNGNPPAASSTEVCLASSDPGCFPSSGRLQVLRKRGPLMHLMKTVKQGRWMQGDAIVVLFHARWCPYSQALLPLMECLPLHFPSSKLQFFAVDESDVGLRTLIQLGIDAFPVLQVVQPHKTRDWGQTMAVQGPRQLGHIIDKITKITGVEHCTREAFCKHYAVATCPPRTLGIRNPRGWRPY